MLVINLSPILKPNEHTVYHPRLLWRVKPKWVLSILIIQHFIYSYRLISKYSYFKFNWFLISFFKSLLLLRIIVCLVQESCIDRGSSHCFYTFSLLWSDTNLYKCIQCEDNLLRKLSLFKYKRMLWELNRLKRVQNV